MSSTSTGRLVRPLTPGVGLRAMLERPLGPVEPAGRALAIIALTLVAVGIVAVYSASSAVASELLDDPTFFVRRQALWAGLGAVVLFVTMRVNLVKLQRAAMPLLVVTVIMLALVLVPGIGHRVNGALRWFRVGPLSIQPSELAKLSLILWLATHLGRSAHRTHDWKLGTLPAIVPLALVSFLVLIEPDFGTALFLGSIGLCMMLVGGVPVPRLALLGCYAAPVIAWQVAERWDVFARRFSVLGGGTPGDAATYQVEQSLLAFGCGGLFGQGLGAGRQKLFYLPEARTDFVLPVIGEEFGFIGSAAVVLLFVALVVCGMRVALGAARRFRFGFLLSFGLVFWIGLQAVGNIAVTTGSVPTKGIALPFISFGGSSLLVLCTAVGLIYAVSRHVDALAAAEDTPSTERPPRVPATAASVGLPENNS